MFRELGGGNFGTVMKAKKIYKIEDSPKPFCLRCYLPFDSAAFY
jgi:hypothetical protein